MNQITDPSRLAELREKNNYRGQPDRCDACGSAKRAPGLCCIVCGKPHPDVSAISAISAMVDAFLAWPLPSSVRPDACVLDTNYPHLRSGTNLLTADEARQMFEHVLEKVRAKPEAETQPVCDVCGDTEAEHKTNTGYDHAFIGAFLELPPEGKEPHMLSDFRKDIEGVINRYSKENGSNTPDFILAQFLTDALSAWDKAVTAREKWYGREPKPASTEPTAEQIAWFASSSAAQRERSSNPPPDTIAEAIGNFEKAGGTVIIVPPKTGPPMGLITNAPIPDGERCCYPPKS